MATVTMQDYRRTDMRTNVLATPYWISSAEIDEADCEDKAAVLFSFPDANEKYFIHQLIVEVTEVFAGGTPAFTLGIGSLATDAVTTGGDVTTVDLDEYANLSDVTVTSLGLYLPGATRDLGAAQVANALTSATASAEMLIQGAATTVPCIVAYASSDASLTAGKLKVHILVSKLQPAGM